MSTATARAVPELLNALAAGIREIRIAGVLKDVPGLQLAPGQSLAGVTESDALYFVSGSDGIAVTADNQIAHLILRADARARCIYMAPESGVSVDGTLELRNLRTSGQVQLILNDRRSLAEVRIVQLHTEAADTRPRRERPAGNGVASLQGAITIWNRAQLERELRVDLSAVTVGEAGKPRVFGSGVMLSGSGAMGGGTLRLGIASIGPIQISSGLRPGNQTTICGGVFVLYGVEVQELRSEGLQESHGPNAVPIDNWGRIKRWTVRGDVVTYGPNAVAVVNAGALERLEIRGHIETHGEGARGCAVYGPMGELRVQSICTRGAGATGVQICDRLGLLSVERGIEIRGKAGKAMVKGRIEQLSADGVHIEAGGRLLESEIAYVSLSDPCARAVRDEAVLDGSLLARN